MIPPASPTTVVATKRLSPAVPCVFGPYPPTTATCPPAGEVVAIGVIDAVGTLDASSRSMTSAPGSRRTATTGYVGAGDAHCPPLANGAALEPNETRTSAGAAPVAQCAAVRTKCWAMRAPLHSSGRPASESVTIAATDDAGPLASSPA
jgi:hypothetical protein